jgi:Ca2+/Na+ antiporter
VYLLDAHTVWASVAVICAILLFIFFIVKITKEHKTKREAKRLIVMAKFKVRMEEIKQEQLFKKGKK